MEHRTLAEFQALDRQLRASGQKPFELGYGLAQSPYIEHHYGYIAGDEEFSSTVWGYFEKHGANGVNLLLARIREEQDPEIRSKILSMLGKIVDNHPDAAAMAPTVVSLLCDFAQNGANPEREKATIALGWIGRLPQADLLGRLMVEDSFETVRTWAASSFMQMAARMDPGAKEKLKELSLPYFRKALEQETDIFAVGVMAASLGDLWGKKFGVSWSAVEARDVERIEKARKSALRFTKKTSSL